MVDIPIPYRLNNQETIEAAIKQNVLNLTKRACKYLLLIAQKVPLEYPAAFLQARKVVRKDFTMFVQMEQFDFVYDKLGKLDLDGNFKSLENKVPWAKEIAGHADIFRYLETFPQETKNAWGVVNYPSLPTRMLDAQIQLRRVAKREILHFVKTGRSKLADLDHVKKLVVAFTLFDLRQEDVLHALRQDRTSGEFTVIYQNALAELLFVRIPRMIKELLVTDPRTIRRKFFAKIDSLALSSRQRMNIFSCFGAGINRDDLLIVLNRISRLISIMSIPVEKKQKIISYIDSLQKTIERVPEVYREWFLDRELQAIHQLNKTGTWMKTMVVYTEEVLESLTKVIHLEFYPTKDYLDLYKGIPSGDCIRESLGEEHIRTPNYFSVRIFLQQEWIGNIYMLDFVDQNGVLLIDRIQIPRKLKVFYHRFFDTLNEVFQELFTDVPYESIVVPLTISNHSTLQKLFNIHRKTLPSVNLSLQTPQGTYFESLRGHRKYYILVQKQETGAENRDRRRS